MRTNWTRHFIYLFVAMALIIGPAAGSVQAGGPGGNTQSEKISPELRAMLTSNPNGDAGIIVEMRDTVATPVRTSADKPENRAKDRIEQRGGRDAKPLGIVRGASGKISLGQLAQLSLDPDVRYISYDTPLTPQGSPYSGDMVDFSKALNADQVWATGVSGKGVTVAVIDSGVQPLPAGINNGQLVASVDLITGKNSIGDPGGHGTHVAGVIAGSHSGWSGVAPSARIASVRVIDDASRAMKSTVIMGIQWAVQNRKAYGIRVINLSLGAPATMSYTQDPLAGAVEFAWHAGIVVVAAAGNNGPAAGTIQAPAYDPYVITVGAMDMSGTADRTDDVLAFFSSRGPTIDGLAKPDVAAPGRKILSTRVPGSTLDMLFPDRIIQNDYLRLSGTSQAAAAVSGVVALMLSANPMMTPDQVKQQLKASASKVTGFDANAVGAGYVNATGAVKFSGAQVSQSARPADSFALAVLPLIKGKAPLVWKDLGYNGGVDSLGRAWSNVAWDNVAWDNIAWDNTAWDNTAWDNTAWDNTAWDNTAWDNTSWDNTSWDSAGSLD
ncbi:MAG: S8 family serine peptidase [Dehalococcoidia bacterium]|nr:S8 family serine peptidase [Dehalococcoidia bacterium]